jgi:hypothetical protein
MLAGCGSDAPTASEQLAARADRPETSAFTPPPLSRPPEYGARPEVDETVGTGDEGPTVFRRESAEGAEVPPEVARIEGLSDGSRALLARAMEGGGERAREAGRRERANRPDPELVERLATGGDVTGRAKDGREVTIEREEGFRWNPF